MLRLRHSYTLGQLICLAMFITACSTGQPTTQPSSPAPDRSATAPAAATAPQATAAATTLPVAATAAATAQDAPTQIAPTPAPTTAPSPAAPGLPPTLAGATVEATAPPEAGTAPDQPLVLHEVQIAGAPGSLLLPEGFEITVFAGPMPARPRLLAFSPNGVLHVSMPQAGTVVALPDANGDGVSDEMRIVASGLNRPHGIAFHDGALWVAETGAVLRLTDPDAQGRYQQRETIIGDMPAGGQHWTRTIGFGPDGGLYVAAGSSCDVCIEKDPRRAAITRYNPDGSNPQTFAKGLRNAVGFTWNARGELVATNNGRDMLGDDTPPETINIAHGGEDFGWPRCHSGDIVDPEFGHPGSCDGVAQPVFKMQAHSAPLGLAFYTGDQFPPQFKGDLFVAFHGSWNRSQPTGYKVVRLRMEHDRPVAIDDFITGWLQGAGAWGRPVDIAIGPDGSMYISDDAATLIYRVRYAG